MSGSETIRALDPEADDAADPHGHGEDEEGAHHVVVLALDLHHDRRGAVAGGLMATYISFGPFVGFDYVIIMYSGVVLGGKWWHPA